MKLVDLCGHESDFCNYHNTINLQSSLGLGGVVNFQWTPYEIESQSNPVIIVVISFSKSILFSTSLTSSPIDRNNVSYF